MKKRYKILLFLALVFVIAFYVVSIHVLPYAIIQPPRVESVNHLESTNIEYKEINLRSFDSINLNGYHVKSSIDTTYASIILVHGIGGCKEHFTQLAIDLSQRGYDSWIFDNRAHGKSEGIYSTYGFYEKRDLSEVVSLIEKELPNTRIGIWGNSLGGAIAIQTLEYDKRIDFGISESTFTDLRQIVYDYQKRYLYGIGIRFACNISLNEAGKIAGFNPDEVSPIKSVVNINQPLLITHGDADKNINFEYGKALYDNLNSVDKAFIAVKEGGHYGLFETGGIAYKEKLYNFIKTNSRD